MVNTRNFDLRQVAADRLCAAADSPARTLAAVRSTCRGSSSIELLSTRTGLRPMPTDGEPIVGPVAEAPGLYLVVMHSAVTLAPAVGALVARELVDDTVESALTGCRLARFWVSRWGPDLVPRSDSSASTCAARPRGSGSG